MTTPIRSIRGMNDILPEDMHYWYALEKAAVGFGPALQAPHFVGGGHELGCECSHALV